MIYRSDCYVITVVSYYIHLHARQSKGTGLGVLHTENQITPIIMGIYLYTYNTHYNVLHPSKTPAPLPVDTALISQKT